MASEREVNTTSARSCRLAGNTGRHTKGASGRVARATKAALMSHYWLLAGPKEAAFMQMGSLCGIACGCEPFWPLINVRSSPLTGAAHEDCAWPDVRQALALPLALALTPDRPCPCRRGCGRSRRCATLLARARLPALRSCQAGSADPPAKIAELAGQSVAGTAQPNLAAQWARPAPCRV